MHRTSKVALIVVTELYYIRVVRGNGTGTKGGRQTRVLTGIRGLIRWQRKRGKGGAMASVPVGATLEVVPQLHHDISAQRRRREPS
jgi:hypothetical protein